MSNNTKSDASRQPAAIWTAVLTQLQTQTTRATFDQWLRGTQPIEANGTGYTIAVASEQAVEWLDNRLRSAIERTLAGEIGEPVGVEFVVSESQPAAPVEVERGPGDDDKPTSRFNVRDKRKSKRLYIDNVFFDNGYAKKLGPTGTAIYAVLARHAHNETQDCWPSYNRLAELTGMSRRQAVKKVGELVALNIICVEKVKTPDGRVNEANTYWLLDDSEWLKGEKSK